MEGENLSSRLGGWSARHWKRAVFGWLVIAAGLMVLGNVVGHVQMRDSQSAAGETATAMRMLEQSGMKSPSTESVLIQSRTLKASDGTFQSAIAGVVQTLSGLRNVTNIQNPLVAPGGGGQISRDGHSVLVQFTVAGDPDKAQNKIAPIMDAVAGVQAGYPSLTIGEVGQASATKQINDRFSKDFANAERLTIPVTLLILLASFGALVAAGGPVLLAFSAVLATLGAYALVTHLYAGDFQSTSAVVLMIGMAVGVDYSLFYLRRDREERARGNDPSGALARTAATSGQAVIISGVTVLIAMAGMFIAGDRIFASFAIGTMLVVFSAMIGSVTVLPGLLAKLGDRVDAGRIPYIGKRKHAASESRLWAFVLDRVLRRPLLWLALGAAVLLAAAVPALQMHTKMPSFTDMPNDVPAVTTFHRLVQAFPGAPTPADVVIQAPSVRDPAVAAQIQNLEQTATATGKMFPPYLVRVSQDGTTADVQIPLAGNGDNKASVDALATLRNLVLPRTVGNLIDARYAVAGGTAATVDWNSHMKSRIVWVFAFVLLLAFALLLATFRSIVIPIKAILLNLLSVGAAYGLLVLVFQRHWAEGILGFRSNGAITSWLPMFLFVVLFGLSMDYHVFIISRIKELRDSGLSTEEAVSLGIRRTAGTVTSAAIIMVAVFSILGTLNILMMKQMGVGLGIAVLIDATIIRGVLLPAAMKLLGEWNWWMPRWLEWVPNLSPEGGRGLPPPSALAR
jgi:uncharacterized membrane protein YdfJ with MMPL/SSD domain